MYVPVSCVRADAERQDNVFKAGNPASLFFAGHHPCDDALRVSCPPIERGRVSFAQHELAVFAFELPPGISIQQIQNDWLPTLPRTGDAEKL